MLRLEISEQTTSKVTASGRILMPYAFVISSQRTLIDRWGRAGTSDWQHDESHAGGGALINERYSIVQVQREVQRNLNVKPCLLPSNRLIPEEEEARKRKL